MTKSDVLDFMKRGEVLSEYLLEIKKLSKSFSTNQVLFEVDFGLKAGEIHAIMGENGAGKSTMMNIIDGIVKADNGQVFLNGEEIFIRSPLDAQQHGICFVHQEIALCQDMTVAQNIFMSEISIQKGLVNYQKLAEKAQELLNILVKPGQIDPNAYVQGLSISDQQTVEIAKALSSDCKVLILDEPTASLSEAETQSVYQVMHTLAGRGIGIIYISHRMGEIFDQCDRVSVLRDGHMVSSYEVKDANVQQLVNDMVGREVNAIYPAKSEKIDHSSDDLLLRVEGLMDANKRFEDICFELHRGELLGFAGLIGSGRSEIMESIVGLRKLDAGSVFFHDEDVIKKSTSQIFKSGLVYMSEDRKTTGLFLELNLERNISAMYLELVTEKGMIKNKLERDQAIRMIGEIDIRAQSAEQEAVALSGGNQQKTLIAKVMAKKPEVVIFDEPTRGIDVAAKAEIHRLLRRLVDEGVGVIIVSSELNEIIGMSDRVLIVNEGKIVQEATGDDINSEHIMYYASGAFYMEEQYTGGITQ